MKPDIGNLFPAPANVLFHSLLIPIFYSSIFLYHFQICVKDREQLIPVKLCEDTKKDKKKVIK
jgi:hypothetical protein